MFSSWAAPSLLPVKDLIVPWDQWMLIGVFALNVIAGVQRFMQWREQRKHRKESSE